MIERTCAGLAIIFVFTLRFAHGLIGFLSVPVVQALWNASMHQALEYASLFQVLQALV